ALRQHLAARPPLVAQEGHRPVTRAGQLAARPEGQRGVLPGEVVPEAGQGRPPESLPPAGERGPHPAVRGNVPQTRLPPAPGRPPPAPPAGGQGGSGPMGQPPPPPP